MKGKKEFYSIEILLLDDKKSADEPEKQVVSDDDYDMSDKSQNSQIGTMESNAVHVEETDQLHKVRKLIITCKLL